MALKLKQLDNPPTIQVGDGYLLVAPDAGHGAGGAEANLMLLQERENLAPLVLGLWSCCSMSDPTKWEAMVENIHAFTGVERPDIQTILLQLSYDIEGRLRTPKRKHESDGPLAHRVEQQTFCPDGPVSPHTHVANGARIVQQHAETLRFVSGGVWMFWTGTHWGRDTTKKDAIVSGVVKELSHRIRDEADTLMVMADVKAAAAQTKDGGVDLVKEEEADALYAQAEARRKWAAASEHRTILESSLHFAKGELRADYGEFDADPMLFNCLNGTLDLRNGTLRAHIPDDRITRLAPVNFDPAATCPTIGRFMHEMFNGDTAMVAFIQRAIGSTLTGIVRDKAIFFLYGPTANNGKTTLVELILDLLGVASDTQAGYGRKVNINVFTESKDLDDSQRKTAQLAGPRFVCGSEVGERARLDEQLIKDITGLDSLEGRFLYRESFTFKPAFKPWLYGNHKPQIRGTDNAIWSRVKLIECEVCFAGREDKELPQKMRAELPGFLNWALQGCLAWQAQGLQEPEKVRLATEAYRHEEDFIGQFIRERCVTLEGIYCKSAQLWAEFKQWVIENGYAQTSQTMFGKYLENKGYKTDNNITGRGTIRYGIGLKEPCSESPNHCERSSAQHGGGNAGHHDTSDGSSANPQEGRGGEQSRKKTEVLPVLPLCYPLKSEQVAGSQQETTPRYDEVLPVLPLTPDIYIGKEGKKGENIGIYAIQWDKEVAQVALSPEDIDYTGDNPATCSFQRGSKGVAPPVVSAPPLQEDIVPPLPSASSSPVPSSSALRRCPHCESDAVRFFKGTRGVCYACGKQSNWEERP